jgi:hypothetical protein
MPRRTVRKPTRWTPEEWARVTDAARARCVPPLRYVREAAPRVRVAPRVLWTNGRSMALATLRSCVFTR